MCVCVDDYALHLHARLPLLAFFIFIFVLIFILVFVFIVILISVFVLIFVSIFRFISIFTKFQAEQSKEKITTYEHILDIAEKKQNLIIEILSLYVNNQY